jgi:hypothetical protein
MTLLKRLGYLSLMAAMVSMTILGCKKDDDNKSSSGGGGGGGGGGLSSAPATVAVQEGNTATNIITGGTQPYAIQTAPNTSIATAVLTGTTLTITGVAAGSTSVIVEDSGSANTVTIPITVTSAGGGGTLIFKSGTIAMDVDGTNYSVTSPPGLLTISDSSGALRIFAMDPINGSLTISGVVISGSGTYTLPTGAVKVMDDQFDTFTNTSSVASGVVITSHSSAGMQGTFGSVTVENVLDPTDKMVITNGTFNVTP